MRNAEVLNAIANDDFQTELGQFNIEINVPPTRLAGANADELETKLRASLNDAEERSRAIGAHIVMVGILPTLGQEHLTHESLSANPRYALINEQIFEARGEDITIAIDGVERLATSTDTIAPEAACTSVQFHLQVSPQQYAATWNAAQCIAGVQVALGANSPFLYGKELWRETRIALFEQATDTRPEELKAQGVRPRVWFGERWITSIFDQFEENVRYFPALLPIVEDEDPGAVLDRGDTPDARRAAHAQRHDLPLEPPGVRRAPRQAAPAGREPGAAGRADRRRRAGQRRVLLRPAARADQRGPAAVDADVVHRRRGQLQRRRQGRHQRPALLARVGRGAGHRAGAAPAAADGPRRPGRLGRRQRRSATGCSGSSRAGASPRPTAPSGRPAPSTQIDDHDRPLDRRDALREMLRRYIEHMHSNQPVHTWA